MKITQIDTYYPSPRVRLVKIATDQDLVGWGEFTLEGKPLSTASAVKEIADYLTGKDPLRIEHHWQHIYRSAFNRGGAALMAALSGIDQALWDIAGKYFDSPVYRLLGGPVRNRVRVYAHWGIPALDEEAKDLARKRLEELTEQGGYTAFKTGLGGKWRAHEPPAVIDGFVKRAYLMREWVGPEVELAFDFHGKLAPGLAIEICREIAGMRPMFVEEPVPQENVESLKLVSDHVSFPIATGERLLSRWEFREVIEKQAVSFIQPDCSHAGGITEVKKIANMAEVYYIHIMPHNAIGPVALAACLQVDAAVPNFLIQEHVERSLGAGLLAEQWKVRKGFIELPNSAGLGVEVDAKAVERNIDEAVEELGGEYYHESDGSVADW